MNPHTADVVVVGGGVVGLSLAYQLASQGVDLVVVDQGPLGRGSSWAGAGMLAPPCALPPTDPLEVLRDLSVRLHADWALALREQTGIDTGYRKCGGIEVALTEAEAAELEEMRGRWHAAGIRFESMAGADLARLESGLTSGILAAVHFPEKAQIRNPWHVRALVSAVSARGVRLLPGCAVRSLVMSGERLVAVETEAGLIACGQAVICAGAWSERVLAGVGVTVSTPPVKGQIVLLDAGGLAPGRIVEHGSQYLVPRQDGRVLVGSTEEHAGFDVRTTAVAIQELLDEALRLYPDLEKATVETAWAGLRPGSMDALPYLGAVPQRPGLFVATGHLRAGLQLSPGTAVVMADLLMGRTPRIDLHPFRIEREPERQAPLFRS